MEKTPKLSEVLGKTVSFLELYNTLKESGQAPKPLLLQASELNKELRDEFSAYFEKNKDCLPIKANEDIYYNALQKAEFITNEIRMEGLNIRKEDRKRLPKYLSILKDAYSHSIGEHEFAKGGSLNPWAVCTASTGREDKRKYESCVMQVKDKYNMAKGGNLNRNEFVSQVKKMHESIDEVVLKDGTHIPGSALMAKGGQVYNENAEMVMNQNNQIKHHSKELESVVDEKTHVPAWVVSKVSDAANDLSDATHFLDGQKNKYAEGGEVTSIVKKWVDRGDFSQAYRVNNKRLAGNLITKEQYEINWNYINQQKANKAQGGELNNMETESRKPKMVRSIFEEEEFEYAQGGYVRNIKVGDIVNLPEIKFAHGSRKGEVQFERVENGVVEYINENVYGIFNPKTRKIHQVTIDQIETFAQGGELNNIETESRKPKMVRSIFEEEEFEYAKGGGVGLTKADIEILGIPRNRITEKEWKSILSMAKYQSGATFLLKDEKGLDIIPQVEYEWYVKDKYAKGGIITFEDGFEFKEVSKEYAKKNWDKEHIFGIDKNSETETLIEDESDLDRFENFGIELGYPDREMADGGELSNPTEYFNSLHLEYLPEKASTYLRDNILNDSDLALISNDFETLNDIKELISEKYPQALTGEVPTASLEDMQEELNAVLVSIEFLSGDDKKEMEEYAEALKIAIEFAPKE